MANKILISGAGIGGLVSALHCQQSGFEVEIFEQAAGPESLGAGIQLSPNASRILCALGLEEVLQPYISTPDKAAFLHYESGAQLLDVALGEAMSKRYGAPYWHIHRADLAACLTTAATARAIPIHYGVKLNDFVNNEDQLYVLDNQNRKHTGQILIIADGIHSTLCQKISGPTQTRFTGQKAWRGSMPSTLLNSPSADSVKNFLGPDKHFVTYPLRQGELINFVAVTQSSAWIDDSWRQTGDVEELRLAFAGWHPEVQNILQHTESCQLWGLFDRPVARHWYNGRAVLIGDAGHAMLPFLAQGAAMAIEDGYVLGAHLAHYGAQPIALKHYQAARYRRVKRVQRRATRNTALYHAKSPFAQLSQRLTFAVVRQLQTMGVDPLAWLYGYDPVARLSD
jgi:salicylate hydroxylase